MQNAQTGPGVLRRPHSLGRIKKAQCHAGTGLETVKPTGLVHHLLELTGGVLAHHLLQGEAFDLAALTLATKL
jgi:hypothetical protein